MSGVERAGGGREEMGMGAERGEGSARAVNRAVGWSFLFMLVHMPGALTIVIYVALALSACNQRGR